MCRPTTFRGSSSCSMSVGRTRERDHHRIGAVVEHGREEQQSESTDELTRRVPRQGIDEVVTVLVAATAYHEIGARQCRRWRGQRVSTEDEPALVCVRRNARPEVARERVRSIARSCRGWRAAVDIAFSSPLLRLARCSQPRCGGAAIRRSTARSRLRSVVRVRRARVRFSARCRRLRSRSS